MSKPQPGDIVRCLPGQSCDFYVIVESVENTDPPRMYGPLSQEATNHHWDENADGTEFRPAPHEDGDYVVTDPAEYDRVWADYCAAMLLGESN